MGRRRHRSRIGLGKLGLFWLALSPCVQGAPPNPPGAGSSKGKGKATDHGLSPPDTGGAAAKRPHLDAVNEALEWTTSLMNSMKVSPERHAGGDLTYASLAQSGWHEVPERETGDFDWIGSSDPLLKLRVPASEVRQSRQSWRHGHWQSANGGDLQPGTDALYDQLILPDHGIIAVGSMDSPQQRRDQAVLAGHRVPTNLPTLSDWSDVTILLWQQASTIQTARPLQWIFGPEVTDVTTLSMISDFVGDFPKNTMAWPGHFFPISHDKGKALLGSPAGQGPALLIANHQLEFKHRMIGSVVVYDAAPASEGHAGAKFHLAFYIIGSTGNEQGSPAGDPMVGVEHGHVGSEQGPQAAHFTAGMEPDSPAQHLWQQAIGRGTESLRKFQERAAKQSDFTDFADLDSWGWHRHKQDRGTFIFDAVQAPFRQLQLAPEHYKGSLKQRGYTSLPIGHTGPKKDKGFTVKDGNNQVLCRPTLAAYHQVISFAHGVMVIQLLQPPSVKAWDDLPSKALYTLPKLVAWSDVAFLLWEKERPKNDKRLDSLEWIFQVGIDDDEENDIIDMALGELGPIDEFKSRKGWPGIQFPTTSKEGQALLGLLAGQQVSNLLAEHRSKFPHGYVSEVVVYDVETNWGSEEAPDRRYKHCLAFHITRMPETGSTDSSDKDAGGNIDGSSALTVSGLWRAALTKGTSLIATMGSAGSDSEQKPTGFGTGDLTKWGWTTSFPDRSKLEKYQNILHGAGFSVSVQNYLGGSNQGRLYDALWLQSGWAGHGGTMAIKDNDGRSHTYHATGASFRNLFGVSEKLAGQREGVIAVETFVMPAQEGGVAKIAEVDWPLISEWSDLSFILWRKYCSELTSKTDVKQLGYVLFIDLTHGEGTTLALVKEIIDKHSVALPAWPGTIFPLTQDAGKVLIGSPRGSSVAKLLIEYSKALGGRVIDQVHLFNCKRKDVKKQVPCIAFRIGEGKASAST